VGGVRIDKGQIIVGGVHLQPSEFRGLVQRHPQNIDDVLTLEAEGGRLLGAELSPGRLRRFVRRVCLWGGYPKTAERVFAQNRFPEIMRRFERATGALTAKPPDLRRALRELVRLRHLGVSFASKHLRLMRPDLCPVLDSTLSGRLGYPLDERGYRRFSEDCLDVAGLLQQHGIANPAGRDNGAWFAADVEMALFVCVKEGRI
jgi:hypothetical protein